MKRVLVTGATGFIGSRLVRLLAQDGWQVAAVVRPESNRSILAGIDDVAWCPYAGNLRDLDAALRDTRPEVVIHLASRFLAAHTPADLDPLLDANVRFGLQLAESMSNAGCNRLVNAGTTWQHLHNAAYCPANLYAATKQAYESLFRYYVDASGLRVTTLKLSDTYGPGDTRRKLLPQLKERARSGEPIDLSPGEQSIDLVHVSDVADAFLLAATRLLEGAGEPPIQDFAVTSGQPLSLRALVARIERVLGRPLPVRWGARPYRPREVMTPWTAGTSLPGWHPRVDLDIGLADYFNDTGGRVDRAEQPLRATDGNRPT